MLFTLPERKTVSEVTDQRPLLMSEVTVSRLPLRYRQSSVKLAFWKTKSGTYGEACEQEMKQYVIATDDLVTPVRPRLRGEHPLVSRGGLRSSETQAPERRLSVRDACWGVSSGSFPLRLVHTKEHLHGTIVKTLDRAGSEVNAWTRARRPRMERKCKRREQREEQPQKARVGGHNDLHAERNERRVMARMW